MTRIAIRATYYEIYNSIRIFFFLDLPEECEISGVQLTGKPATKQDVLPIAELAFCKALCAQMDGACAYFSHDASRGECALLADVREVVENGDAVSGAAGCEGERSSSA